LLATTNILPLKDGKEYVRFFVLMLENTSLANQMETWGEKDFDYTPLARLAIGAADEILTAGGKKYLKRSVLIPVGI
jgi:hypothetical protein